MKKVAIFCGGPSSEHEVSLSSAQAILNHIDRDKFIPYIFFIKKDLKSSFYKAGKSISTNKNVAYIEFSELLKKEKDNFEVALLAALHGEFGEDGTIQLILENLGIKYTGSDSKSSKICMDKLLTMKIIADIKEINFPKTKKIILNENLTIKSPLEFPVFIKPNALGSSVLAFIIKNHKEFDSAIDEYSKNGIKEILVQELIDGIEIQCGCLEKKNGELIKLPPIEIRPNSDFFDYNSKYDIGGAEEITPPISISKNMSNKISDLTLKIHKRLECRTYSRTDFIYRNKKIYFLEINTLPGMTGTSLLPQEADAAGINFQELITFIINQSI